MPNQVEPPGHDTRIFDIYGNQLDGEFLGNQTSQTSPGLQAVRPSLDSAAVRGPAVRRHLPAGRHERRRRARRRVHDRVSPSSPTATSSTPGPTTSRTRSCRTLSNGSLANPYPVLAPEGNPNSSLASNPTHDPNLGLNNPAFFQPGNFNPSYDFSGDGKFEQSALYAASQLAYNGPVVVVAVPGIPSRNPITGPGDPGELLAGRPGGQHDRCRRQRVGPVRTRRWSSRPARPLKLQNAVAVRAEPGQCPRKPRGPRRTRSTSRRTTTPRVGGATNNNPDTTPHPGDWGGIVFRNYDHAIASQQQTASRSTASLVGPNGGDAISGAQDAMSILNFADIRYAGGAVPQGSSTFYSGDHPVQLPPDDHQRQHRQHRRDGRHRGGHRRRLRLVPRGRHGPRPADPQR